MAIRVVQMLTRLAATRRADGRAATPLLPIIMRRCFGVLYCARRRITWEADRWSVEKSRALEELGNDAMYVPGLSGPDNSGRRR